MIVLKSAASVFFLCSAVTSREPGPFLGPFSLTLTIFPVRLFFGCQFHPSTRRCVLLLPVLYSACRYPQKDPSLPLLVQQVQPRYQCIAFEYRSCSTLRRSGGGRGRLSFRDSKAFIPLFLIYRNASFKLFISVPSSN